MKRVLFILLIITLGILFFNCSDDSRKTEDFEFELETGIGSNGTVIDSYKDVGKYSSMCIKDKQQST